MIAYGDAVDFLLLLQNLNFSLRKKSGAVPTLFLFVQMKSQGCVK